MSVATRLLYRPGGVLFIAWSSIYILNVVAHKCGQCESDCDTSSGLCIGSCDPGWKGVGCDTFCSLDEDCTNPCNCNVACECNTQYMTCTRICMAANSDELDNNDYSGSMFILVLSIIAIIISVIAVCCFFLRQTSHGLRGRILSHPVCAKCPAFRDCLQRIGVFAGLKGLQLGARDSLESFGEEDERNTASYSQRLRQWRRGKPTVVGVRNDPTPIRVTGTSGYKWKKKWRERKVRSKMKRKQKHAERKLRKEGASVESRRGSIILPPLDKAGPYSSPTGDEYDSASAGNPLDRSVSASSSGPSSSSTSSHLAAAGINRRDSFMPSKVDSNHLKPRSGGAGTSQPNVMGAKEAAGGSSPVSMMSSTTGSSSDHIHDSVDPSTVDKTNAVSPAPSGNFVRRTLTRSNAVNGSTDSDLSSSSSGSSSNSANKTATVKGKGGLSKVTTIMPSSTSANVTNSAVGAKSGTDISVVRPDTWTTPVEVISGLTEVLVTKPSNELFRQPDS